MDEPVYLTFTDAEEKEYRDSLRKDIEANRMIFEFPSGLNNLPLMEECLALQHLDDFEFMYDITMQSLVGKSCKVYIRNMDNTVSVLGEFFVTDRYQNMKVEPLFDAYPSIMLFLTNSIGANLAKKLPAPSSVGSKEEKLRTKFLLKKMLKVN